MDSTEKCVSLEIELHNPKLNRIKVSENLFHYNRVIALLNGLLYKRDKVLVQKWHLVVNLCNKLKFSFLFLSATLVQTTLQTAFILDASSRFACTNDQVKRKPGREVVTFLLVCNLAMWAINTLETNRADSHPIQVRI